MNPILSPNTQAILLLTAPLLVGRVQPSAPLLTPSEYKRLAVILREHHREPADLLGQHVEECLNACAAVADVQRLRDLLGRGFALSQAVEHWHTRSIWVVSRADAEYPTRLKKRLQADAPAVLYGCGKHELLATRGLAVVGSRDVDDVLLSYTMKVGEFAANARYTIVSGGAHGVDSAAMRGALDAGGAAVGVMADSLERAVMNREQRNMIMESRLTLVSPYDPRARFNVGHAMQRNKLIYALSDAALVVDADASKGGTRAGALEQLAKLHYVPVYIRSTGRPSLGLDALRKKGAFDWPNPDSAEALADLLAGSAMLPQAPDLLRSPPTAPLLDAQPSSDAARVAVQPSASPKEDSQKNDDLAPTDEQAEAAGVPGIADDMSIAPADRVFASVRNAALELLVAPMSVKDFASTLDISPAQAKTWLDKLVTEGTVVKQRKPAGYRRNDPTLL